MIEATEEVEQENKPKQNYFPLSSEKKAGGKVGTNKQVISERVVENDSPIFHSSPRHPSFIEEGTFSVQQVDEYRKKGAKFTFSSRKHKGGESSGNSSGGSSDSSGEFGSLTQQRTKLKQPTSDFYVNGGGRGDNFHWDDSSRREVNRIHHGSGAMCPQSPSQQASPNVATPSIEVDKKISTTLPMKVVMIEDFSFQFETVEVEVGQEVEFRLSGPAHAEHELWGTSTLIALTFESPLLQVQFASFDSFSSFDVFTSLFVFIRAAHF